MSNFRLDRETHDIIINTRSEKVTGVEQIAQLVKNRLLTILTEWPINDEIGLPWKDGLLDKGVPLEYIDLAVRNTILETEGVQSVDHLSFSRKGRTLNIVFYATTTTGEQIDSEVSV